jgi:hypothetical protein
MKNNFMGFTENFLKFAERIKLFFLQDMTESLNLVSSSYADKINLFLITL